MLFTDTSHYACSRVLTQAVESPKDLRPVAFTSGSFSKNAAKEDYAVYQSVLKFDTEKGLNVC